ncbi:MAG: hypothetical protein AAB553_08180 [Patescibacteria group bacterium]
MIKKRKVKPRQKKSRFFAVFIQYKFLILLIVLLSLPLAVMLFDDEENTNIQAVEINDNQLQEIPTTTLVPSVSFH